MSFLAALDPFLLQILSFLLLLGFATLLKTLSEATKLPFSVLLLVFGLLFGVFRTHLPFFQLEFKPEILFYIFLPTLIFESAYHLKFRALRSVFREVVFLSTFGLLVSVFLITLCTHYLLGLPVPMALLFAIIISPTDPVAVLSIFKQIRVPQKLKTLIEGESLLNDGTALILFQAMKLAGFVGVAGISSRSVATGFLHYLITVFASVGVGLGFGFVFLMMFRATRSRSVHLTLSFLLAHITFIVAESLLHFSGVMAVMTAGILMGNISSRNISSSAKIIFEEMWTFLSFISNALVFLLLGIKLGELNLFDYWKQIAIASAVVIGLARPLSVFVIMNLINITRAPKKRLNWQNQTVLVWGGLRGALSAAMVLLVPSSFPLRDLLLAITGGVILVTFLLNANTLKIMLKGLKLDALSFAEKVQSYEAEIAIDKEVREYLQNLQTQQIINAEVYTSVDNYYAKTQQKAEKSLKKIQKSLPDKAPREIEKIMNYHALMIEHEVYEQMYRQLELSEDRFQVLQGSVLRQLGRLEQDILPDERQISQNLTPKFRPEAPCTPQLFFGIPYAFWRKKQKRKIIRKLQHYRARAVAGRQVIADLGHLNQSTCLLCEKQILDKILARYDLWVQNAHQKMEILRQNHPRWTTQAEMAFARYMSLLKEQQLEKSYAKKGLISDKVQAQYELRIDRDLRKNFRSMER